MIDPNCLVQRGQTTDTNFDRILISSFLISNWVYENINTLYSRSLFLIQG